jgi:hypothetical protein
MATNPRALVARVLTHFAGESAMVPYVLPKGQSCPTAADHLEGGARLPLVLVADVTGKNRDVVGQTGSVTATDPMGRGRTIQISRLTMAEYALIPDDAVVRVTIEILS